MGELAHQQVPSPQTKKPSFSKRLKQQGEEAQLDELRQIHEFKLAANAHQWRERMAQERIKASERLTHQIAVSLTAVDAERRQLTESLGPLAEQLEENQSAHHQICQLTKFDAVRSA